MINSIASKIFTSDNKNAIYLAIAFTAMVGGKALLEIAANSNAVYGYVLITILTQVTLIQSCNKKIQPTLVLLFGLYLYLIGNTFLIGNIQQGVAKASIGLILPSICVVAVNNFKISESIFAKALILCGVGLSIIAVADKAGPDFYLRGGRFGLLGPITFGWVNAMAFLATAIEEKRAHFKIPLLAIFLAMILWSGSKGPLVGLFVTSIFAYRRLIPKSKKSIFIALIISSILFYFILMFSTEIRAINMLIEYASDPSGYSSGNGAGSFGLRQIYRELSAKLFYTSPVIGIGFGSWPGPYPLNHNYPHNIIAEILSEAGIIGLAIITTIFSVFNYKNIFGFVGIFSIVTLMFSGDAASIRYALFPLMIGLLAIETHKIKS